MQTKTWNDITLRQFLKIKELITEEQDEYTVFNLLDIVYNINSVELPISEIKNYSLEFLKTEMPKPKLKKYYTINGHTYDSHFDLTSIATGQFIDYTNYCKNNSSLEKLISVFFTPEGKSYNSGYDIREVQNDILDLSIPVVNELAFFFKTQLSLYTKIFQQSLIRQAKKIKMPKVEKKKVISALKQMDLCLLVSFTGYTNLLKKQTQK